MLNLIATYFYITTDLLHVPNNSGVYKWIEFQTKIPAMGIKPLQSNALSGMSNNLINYQRGNM